MQTPLVKKECEIPQTTPAPYDSVEKEVVGLLLSLQSQSLCSPPSLNLISLGPEASLVSQVAFLNKGPFSPLKGLAHVPVSFKRKEPIFTEVLSTKPISRPSAHPCSLDQSFVLFNSSKAPKSGIVGQKRNQDYLDTVLPPKALPPKKLLLLCDEEANSKFFATPEVFSKASDTPSCSIKLFSRINRTIPPFNI